jgi:hypothetical protein
MSVNRTVKWGLGSVSTAGWPVLLQKGAHLLQQQQTIWISNDDEKELEEKEGREREDEREGACNLRLVEVTRDAEVETWPARLPATIAISCTRREGWRREKVLTATSDAIVAKGLRSTSMRACSSSTSANT